MTSAVSHGIESWLDQFPKSIDQRESSTGVRHSVGAKEPDLKSKTIVKLPQKSMPCVLMLKNGGLKNIETPSTTQNKGFATKIHSPADSALSESQENQAYVPPHKRAAASTPNISKPENVEKFGKIVPNISANKLTYETGSKECASSAKNTSFTYATNKRANKQKKVRNSKKPSTVKSAKPVKWGFSKKERALNQPWR